MAIKKSAHKKLYDRLYQKANRARLAARRRERYATDPEYRQQQKDAAKKYRVEHHDDPGYRATTRKGARAYQQRKRDAAKLAAEQAATSNTVPGHE